MKKSILHAGLLLLLMCAQQQTYSQGKARFNKHSYVTQGLKLSAADKEALLKEYSKIPGEKYLLIIDGKVYGKASVTGVLKSARDLGHTGLPDIKDGQGGLMEWCALACTITTNAVVPVNRDAAVLTMDADLQKRIHTVMKKYSIAVVEVPIK